jgi:hypothetical protein
MAREYFACGRNDPDALILVFLSLDGAEQLTARIFCLTHLVQVHGDGHKAVFDALYDLLVR